MQDSTSSRSGGQRPRTRTLATLSDGMLCPQSPRFDMMQLTQSVCMKNTPVGCPCRFGRELPGAAVRAPCSRTGSSFGRRGGCPQPATPSWPTAGSRARRRALRRRCSRSPATCRSHPERLQSTGHTHKNWPAVPSHPHIAGSWGTRAGLCRQPQACRKRGELATEHFPFWRQSTRLRPARPARSSARGARCAASRPSADGVLLASAVPLRARAWPAGSCPARPAAAPRRARRAPPPARRPARPPRARPPRC